MNASGKNLQLDTVMETLGLNASTLSKVSNVDSSIINKWRRGSRKITNRSVALIAVAEALIELDTQQLLKKYYAPHQSEDIDITGALINYLLGEDLPSVVSNVTIDDIPKSGTYTLQYTVYLGKKGYRKAALAMLDYALLLPPGQTITVLCRGRYDWIVDSMSFVLQFINKLPKVFARGTRLVVIARKDLKMTDVRIFAIPWIIAHLRGHIRSTYYEGELNDDLRFVASIPGYWGAKATEEPTVEDSLYLRICTDPYETQKDAAICDAFIKMSEPSSQYSFFSNPEGDQENIKLWNPGSLPVLAQDHCPDGSFNVFCKVPGLGLLTKDEVLEISGEEDISFIPDFLFCTEGAYTNLSHKIILCKEDIKEGLSNPSRKHEVLSLIMGREVHIKKEHLRKQIERILAEMSSNKNFQIALMPRIAFNKLKVEMICWTNSVTVAWLQDSSESVLIVDKNSFSYNDAIEYVWEKSLAGWKRQTTVSKTLRDWLSGKGLTDPEKSSAIVQNWTIMGKED